MAAEASEAYSNRCVYVVEGRKGLWRRVPMSTQEERHPANMVAYYQLGLIELTPWQMGTAELAEAGYLDFPNLERLLEAMEVSRSAFLAMMNGGSVAIERDMVPEPYDLPAMEHGLTPCEEVVTGPSHPEPISITFPLPPLAVNPPLVDPPSARPAKRKK